MNKEERTTENFGTYDKKARRRSNVSTTRANITAAQIQQGVTLEELQALNVPVYRYYTQITIHGVLPDITSDTIRHYKALVKNKNGSIGVRYKAIDAEKKALVRQAMSLTEDKQGRYSGDSKGDYIQKAFSDRIDLIAFRKSVPTELFNGDIESYRDMFGRYYIFVNISTIPVCNVWKLIQWATKGNITAQATLDAAIAAREAERAAEQAQREIERAADRAEREAKQAVEKAKIAELYEQSGLPVYNGPIKNGLFIRAYLWTSGDVEWSLVEVKLTPKRTSSRGVKISSPAEYKQGLTTLGDKKWRQDSRDRSKIKMSGLIVA